jgi:hypothetical protein
MVSSCDAGEARRKADRTLRKLKHLKYTVARLMDSVLYREVPRRAAVSTTLTMTNILSNDMHYRRFADLWVAWARLGLDQTPRPRDYFEDMQDLCRAFDRYSLLLTLRALDQLGFEPTALERPLSDGETKLQSGEHTTVLLWASTDGVMTLRGNGISALRLVPLCSSIAMLHAGQLRDLVNDADAGAAADSVTSFCTRPSPRRPPTIAWNWISRVAFARSPMKWLMVAGDASGSCPCLHGTS